MFERGVDPKKSLGVGLNKDAIDIDGVAFFTRSGTKTELLDPDETKLFLSMIERMELPSDPIFCPHDILFQHTRELTEEEILASLRKVRMFSNIKGSNSVPSNPTNPDSEITFRKTYRKDEIRILDHAGKGIRFQGKLYRVPSEEEIKEKMKFIIIDRDQRLKAGEESIICKR